MNLHKHDHFPPPKSPRAQRLLLARNGLRTETLGAVASGGRSHVATLATPPAFAASLWLPPPSARTVAVIRSHGSRGGALHSWQRTRFERKPRTRRASETGCPGTAATGDAAGGEYGWQRGKERMSPEGFRRAAHGAPRLKEITGRPRVAQTTALGVRARECRISPRLPIPYRTRE